MLIELTREQEDAILYNIIAGRLKDAVEEELAMYGDGDEELEYIKSGMRELIESLHDKGVMSYSDTKMLIHDIMTIADITAIEYREEVE